MSAKFGNCLYTVPSLGLPVLGVILLILILINAVSNLQKIFTINTKKETGAHLVIGDET